MKPPIVINENGSLAFFKSVAEAERYLEPIDVKNQEYGVYDSDGRRLDLRVEGEVAPGLLGLGKTNGERIRISQAEDTATHAEELKNLLHSSLQKLETSSNTHHTATLQELIAVTITRMGFS